MRILVCLWIACFIFISCCGSAFTTDQEWERLIEKGNVYMQKGLFAEAVELYSTALNFPESDEENKRVVTLARAHAYYYLGRLEDSLKDINNIISLQKIDGETRASSLNLRGKLHLSKGHEDSAMRDFTDAIKTPHESDTLRARSFANRVTVFLNQGKLQEATSDFNKSIELDSCSGYAYACRGLAYLRMGKIQEARRDARDARAKTPDKETMELVEKIDSGIGGLVIPIDKEGHLFVQVSFSEKGTPHRFLLDTGATYSLIDQELLSQIEKETGVKNVGKARVKTADGAEHAVTRYKVKSAFLFHLPLGEIEVHVFDKKISKIINLLGMKSLKQISVSIYNSGRKARINLRDHSTR
jgi:tetratricopeptide (TPR) repeat protein